MVNEINKPPTSENIILGERLAESNRQLREMQEEHRMLLNEMQTLRQRAAELARLNAEELELQQQQQAVQTEAATNTIAATATAATDNAEQSQQLATTAQEVAKTDKPSDAAAATANEKDNLSNETTENDSEEKDDPETAAYIQQKVAEIAAMKAQYKRVQNMINTTNLIEQHLGASSDVDNATQAATVSSNNAELAISPALMENLTAAAAAQDTTTQRSVNEENGELISAMMNMFTDFTSDLRSQAENLRAERDRIRLLKEELLSRKRQS